VVEKLAAQDCRRRLATKLGDAADKVDTTDVVLAVVPDIVENYEWPV
jgi:hypothetical protein